MQQPKYELRQRIAEQSQQLRGLADEEAEKGLEDLLTEIQKKLETELRENPPEQQESDSAEIVSSCHAWASLASHAVAEVYAPNSPFPRNVAGWGQNAIRCLNQISATLRTPLAVAKRPIGAGFYSISVGFPWGVSISFSWS